MFKVKLMKKSTLIAFCSISTALGVVLLFLGGISFIFAYLMPMIVGIMTIALRETFGWKSAIITYLSTTLLSVFLVADKECLMMYIAFFGYYPIVKPCFDKIKPFAVSFILKLIFFNIALAASELFLVYVLGIPFLEEGEGKIFIAVFGILMNILFVIYDKLLVTLDLLYVKRIEKRIKKFL